MLASSIMKAADIQQRFGAWRDRHARPAWKPRTIQGGASTSRFGGSALLGPGESWPSCKSCGDPMQFFLQLEMSALPPEFARRRDGLLQLFYCSRDDGDCETWAPFSGTHLVRLIGGERNVVPHPHGLEPFAVRSVEGWQELVDYPSPAEHDELGLVYEYDFPKKRVSARCKELGLELLDADIDLGVAEAISLAEPGDKLGGWPAWVQGVEYPPCSQCQRPMRLVLQVDSEDNVPHMFGDVGCGHITQCPDHPNVLAFGWACG